MKRVLVFLFAIGIVFYPGAISAQNSSIDLSIESIPLNPEPGATVLLTAKSYALDLSQANLVWTYNSTVVAQGTGKITISIVAPKSGTTGVITVSTTGAGLENASSGIILRPGSLDVLWEAADAHTPPFYKGKALLPVNGVARLTAIPSSSAPKNLSYTWSRNGQAIPEQSGYNKSSMVIKHSEFNPQEMVELNASGGSFSSTTMTRLNPETTPTLLAYQNKGGFIDYANGYADTIVFDQPGIVLHFEPYYFSIVRNILNDLVFDLMIDGETVSGEKGNEIGLSRPESSGQSTLTMKVTPLVYSLQHIEKSFNLLFN